MNAVRTIPARQRHVDDRHRCGKTGATIATEHWPMSLLRPLQAPCVALAINDMRALAAAVEKSAGEGVDDAPEAPRAAH